MPNPERERALPPTARVLATADRAVRPFLKWAGGKRQLLPRLRRFYPVAFGTYFEPFMGSGAVEQVRPQRVVIELAGRGCQVVLSNSTAPLIEELYERNEPACAAGLRAHRAAAKRAINSNASRRGEVAEFIITNVAERKVE